MSQAKLTARRALASSRSLRPVRQTRGVRGPDGERLELPEGSFTVPVPYRDVTTSLTVCAAPLAALRELVPALVEPQRLFGNEGGFVFYFVDAKNTGFGAYQEMALGVLCRRGLSPDAPDTELDWYPPPMFLIWFAVSAPLPRAAGRLIWGFPKTEADTRVTSRESVLCCSVGDGREPWLRFHGTQPTELEPAEVGLRSLTLLDDRLCETTAVGSARLGKVESPSYELEVLPGFPARHLVERLPLKGTAVAGFLLEQHGYELDWPLAESEA